MLVFAFDRDWTVDVNPHPRREAVPLDWVRHLAHETDHAVYAIGNQALADEASIPGVVDVVGRHPDDWDQWLGEKLADGYYERFPTRRERLALIADLHPDADSYVVVDDLDLSDVDGWEHYHAWEFVPAVERGDVHPSLPWVREPMTDGGLRTMAGVMPTDVAMLADFLEKHPDAPGYKLRYTDDGEEQTRLLHDFKIIDSTLERPAAAPAVKCTPLEPGESTFTIGVWAVEMLHVVEPPPDCYTTGTETLHQEAVGLRRKAEVHPETVNVSSVLTLIDREDEEPFHLWNALEALRCVAAVRPEDCKPALPILRSLLEEDDFVSPLNALATLRHIGEDDRGAIAPLTAVIVPYLDAENEDARREATRCLATIAEVYPEDAIDAVPALATVIEDEAPGQKYAVYALSCITREYPVEVKPTVETLGGAVLDESLADGVRLNATAALGRIVGEFPSTGVDIVDDVAELFDAENHKLRNNAIGLVGDVATVHTDVVEPYADDIADLLVVDDTYTRINASAALARVAEDFPDSVDHVVPTFIDLLSDEHPLVRQNACWALGYLRAEEAEEALQEQAQDDENEDVRERAAWAVRRIEG